MKEKDNQDKPGPLKVTKMIHPDPEALKEGKYRFIVIDEENNTSTIEFQTKEEFEKYLKILN